MIDTHHHMWGAELSEYPFLERPGFDELRRPFGVDELAADARESHVIGTVVVEARETPDETDWLLELASTTPLVVGVVGWEDLLRADLGDRLERLLSGPHGDLLVGVRIRLHQRPDAGWILGGDARRGLVELARAQLALDLLVRPAQLKLVAEVARRHPELRLVVDHLACPQVGAEIDREWADGLALLAPLENVYWKISGLFTLAAGLSASLDHVRRYVEHAVATLGTDRLMLGSDWPICRLARSYEATIGAYLALMDELAPGVRAAFAAETAARAYRIERGHAP